MFLTIDSMQYKLVRMSLNELANISYSCQVALSVHNSVRNDQLTRTTQKL